MDVAGKVTLITGASGGIGLPTARCFADAGAHIVAVARSADKLAALVDELRAQGRQALPLVADVRDKAAVDAMVEQAFRWLGHIDILVNNAGQSVAGNVAELDLADFRQIVELNVFGPVYAMQAAVPYMRAQHGGGGLIINISSMTSKLRIPGLAGYACTKAALNVLSETARVELAADNIRVITVYPRTTATDFGRNALGDRQLRQRQRAHVPVSDPPELVADRILHAAQTEPSEQYVDA